jgi:hypothetical protein
MDRTTSAGARAPEGTTVLLAAALATEQPLAGPLERVGSAFQPRAVASSQAGLWQRILDTLDSAPLSASSEMSL